MQDEAPSERRVLEARQGQQWRDPVSASAGEGDTDAQPERNDVGGKVKSALDCFHAYELVKSTLH